MSTGTVTWAGYLFFVFIFNWNSESLVLVYSPQSTLSLLWTARVRFYNGQSTERGGETGWGVRTHHRDTKFSLPCWLGTRLQSRLWTDSEQFKAPLLCILLSRENCFKIVRILWNPTLSSTTWWLRSPWSSSPSSRWTTTSQLWTAGRQWGLQDCQDVCPHCQDQRSGRESHWDGYWLLWPRTRTPGGRSTRGWRTIGGPTWTSESPVLIIERWLYDSQWFLFILFKIYLISWMFFAKFTSYLQFSREV